MTTKHISLVESADNEMAWLFIEQEPVFYGNVWDFHPGCAGTRIGGYDLTDWDGTRPPELVNELRLALEADGFTVIDESHTFETCVEAETFLEANFPYDRLFSSLEEAVEEVPSTVVTPAPTPALDAFRDCHDAVVEVGGQRWGVSIAGWTIFANSEDGEYEFEIEGEGSPIRASDYADLIEARLANCATRDFVYGGLTYALKSDGELCSIYLRGKLLTSFDYWNAYNDSDVIDALASVGH